MSESFTAGQIEEIQKILDRMEQMEAIVRSSANRAQVERVQKELLRHRERLGVLVPGMDPTRIDIQELRIRLGGSSRQDEATTTTQPRPRAGSSRSAASGGSQALNILDKFPTEKASPSSSDPDVNFLATVLRTIQREYWPVISEQHTRLDFSTSAERDNVRSLLDNVLRNLKVLTETIEEYAGAEKQDFREQLLKMKSRQTRIFLIDTNTMLKNLLEFLEKLGRDMRSGGGSVVNRNESIHFDKKFENATVLEGRSIMDGILEFNMYVKQAIEQLHMPDMK